MTDATITPTNAYNLLETLEREIVDEYVQYVVNEQHRKRERVIHALYTPIPVEFVRRSRGAIHKPIILAALAERIKYEADKQDMSPDRVIKEMMNIATANIDEFVRTTPFGQIEIKDLTQMPKERISAVKSIESKPNMYGIHTKIVMHDKMPALSKLTDLMGFVPPNQAPVLQEYVKPPLQEEQLLDMVPEIAYQELLDSCVT